MGTSCKIDCFEHIKKKGHDAHPEDKLLCLDLQLSSITSDYQLLSIQFVLLKYSAAGATGQYCFNVPIWYVLLKLPVWLFLNMDAVLFNYKISTFYYFYILLSCAPIREKRKDSVLCVREKGLNYGSVLVLTTHNRLSMLLHLKLCWSMGNISDHWDVSHRLSQSQLSKRITFSFLLLWTL